MMTRNEYAKRIGVSKQYVSKLVKQGKLTTLPDGQIDEVAADRELSRNLSPVKVKIPAPSTGIPGPSVILPAGEEIDLDKPDISLVEAKTAYEIVKTKLAQLDLDEREGRLVVAEDVKREAFSSGRIIRDTILNIPMSVCPSLSCDDKTRFAVEQAMKVEINHILEQLSDELMPEHPKAIEADSK